MSPGGYNPHDPPTRPFRSSEEIRRKVFLAKFDLGSMTPVPTASAYLKMKPEQCMATDVAQISKEHLNIEEDLIMLVVVEGQN